MILSDNVEQILKATLQNNVQFVLNDKIVRQGKIILFTVKDYYISFNFITPENLQKNYEIPIPFSIHKRNGNIFLDYNLHHVTKKEFSNEFLVKQISSKIDKKTKFLNNILVVKCSTTV